MRKSIQVIEQLKEVVDLGPRPVGSEANLQICHLEWPNQNSKTTFIVQTFPKYGPYGFYFVNLSFLGAILAIFQFCGFSGLFWPFFPSK